MLLFAAMRPLVLFLVLAHRLLAAPPEADRLEAAAARFQERGHPSETIGPLRQALDLRRAHYYEGHPETLRSTKLLARAYARLEEWANARPLLESALAAERAEGFPDCLKRRDTAVQLMIVYRRLPDLAALRALREEQLPADGRLDGPGGRWVREGLAELAEITYKLGDYQAARGYQERLLAANLARQAGKGVELSVRRALCDVLSRLHDESAWVAELDRVLALSTIDAAAVYARALFHLAAGEKPQAMALADRVRHLAPEFQMDINHTLDPNYTASPTPAAGLAIAQALDAVMAAPDPAAAARQRLADLAAGQSVPAPAASVAPPPPQKITAALVAELARGKTTVGADTNFPRRAKLVGLWLDDCRGHGQDVASWSTKLARIETAYETNALRGAAALDKLIALMRQAGLNRFDGR